jgi:hypothetical protein
MTRVVVLVILILSSSLQSKGDDFKIRKFTNYVGTDRTMGEYYSNNEEEFESGKYIFKVMPDSTLYITIDGQISALKLITKEKTDAPDAFRAKYKGDTYTLQLEMKYKRKGDYKCKRYEGMMIIGDKRGRKFSQEVYGQSAWKTVYKN